MMRLAIAVLLAAQVAMAETYVHPTRLDKGGVTFLDESMVQSQWNDAAGWYPFASAGSSTTDFSSAQSDGVFGNEGGYVTNAGGCADFDGTNDFFDTLNATSFSDADFTAMCWMYSDIQAAYAVDYVLVQAHTLGPYSSDWIFGVDATFWFRTTAVAMGNVYDGHWHHLAMVWDRTAETYEGFVDGQSVGTSAVVSGYGGAGTVHAGSRPDETSTFFNGKVDDIRIAPAKLAGAAILAHYNATKGVHP